MRKKLLSFVVIISGTILYAGVDKVPEPEEVVRPKLYYAGKGEQPIIYSHGLGGNYKGFSSFGKILNKDNHLIAAFDYPEVVYYNGSEQYRIDPKKATIGQEDDVNYLKQAIEEFQKSKELTEKIILFGYSRGASTIANEMGINNHENVGAIILMAPFSSIEDVVAHKAKEILEDSSSMISTFTNPLLYLSSKLAHKIIVPRIYPNYDPNGMQPIESIDKIDKNIPILIIHSQDDDLCPFKGGEKLYSKLKNQDRDNVYFLVIKGCGHCEYWMKEDVIAGVVNAFYKKYDFIYDEELADGVDMDDFRP